MCTRGLCRGAAGNPRFPRLLPGTLGNTEELYEKDLHDPDNHDGVITDL